MKFYLSVILFLFVSTIQGFAQLHINSVPASQYSDTPSSNIFVEMVSPQSPLGDQARLEGQPMYAGFEIPFNEKEIENGTWTHKNGTQIWQIGIYVDEAKGINVYFEDFNLSEDELLFIYNEDRSTILGGFGEANNGKYMATEFVGGEKIIIELNTTDSSNRLPFGIAGVGVSVLNVFSNGRGFGDSQFCEVPVNCPEGNDWKDEKNSSARILVKEGTSLFWCSGTLMNNTNLDAKPYLLTANHCGETSSEDDFSNWVFYFNFEAEDCEPPALEPDHNSLSGATLIANSNGSTSVSSDFKLMLLNDDVPPSYNPYYSGWDITGDGSYSGVGIHHPEGDLKMISTFNNPVVSTKYNNETPDENGMYWKVIWSETETNYGVTEGGSSGSPIYSQDKYVIGTLSGGRASCSSPDKPDYYGKLSYSWSSNKAEPSTQLKPWLDPVNSGTLLLRGSKIDSTNILANFSASSTDIRVGNKVTFSNHSEGEIYGYEWYFEGGNPEHAEIEYPPAVEYNNAGEFAVRLVAKSYSGNDTLIINDYIHVLPTITPNPSAGLFTVTFGGELPEDLDVKVTNLQGQLVYSFIRITSNNSISVDLTQHASGIYLISVYANGGWDVLKASLIRQTN